VSGVLICLSQIREVKTACYIKESQRLVVVPETKVSELTSVYSVCNKVKAMTCLTSPEYELYLRKFIEGRVDFEKVVCASFWLR